MHALPKNRPQPLSRHALWYVLALAAVILGAGLGLREPWPSDEPRFALVARLMAASGDWLFPHRGAELYPDKPPLFMWLQLLAHALTGSWRVAFLLPSLAAGLACIALVHDLARRLWNRRAALHAALTLLVCIQFTYQFRHAQIDPVLTAWVTLANYGLLRHLLLGPDRRWLLIGCFAAGLGVITKGVGVLALVMLLPFAWARWRGWAGTTQGAPLPARTWIAAGIAFLLPIAAWLIPVTLTVVRSGDAEHAAYLHNILLQQTVNRYVAPSGHLASLAYLPGVIVLEWLPLSLALPWLLPAWWRRLRRRDLRLLLPLGWAALVVLFFSLSPGKRDVYILPVLPMVVLAAAPLLPALLRRKALQRALLACSCLLTGALLFAGLAGLGGWLDLPANLGTSHAGGIWGLLAAMGAAGLAIAILAGRRRAAWGWIGALGSIWLLLGWVGYPLMDADRSGRAIMEQARQLAGPQVSLGLVGWREQHLLQAVGPVAEFGFLAPMSIQFERAATWMRAEPARRQLFVQEPALPACLRRDAARKLGRANRRDWWLVPAAALPPGCPPPAPATAATGGEPGGALARDRGR